MGFESVAAVYEIEHPPIWSDIACIVNGDIPLKRHRHQALSVEERLFILWATSREWAEYSIAMQLHAKPETVRRYREAIFETPSLILSLPLAKQISKRQWLCRICGDTPLSYLRLVRHIQVKMSNGAGSLAAKCVECDCFCCSTLVPIELQVQMMLRFTPES